MQPSSNTHFNYPQAQESYKNLSILSAAIVQIISKLAWCIPFAYLHDRAFTWAVSVFVDPKTQQGATAQRTVDVATDKLQVKNDEKQTDKSIPLEKPVPTKKIPAAPTTSMISYNFSGGRFGDCLVDYFHAKWLAFKYNLPLCFKPFEYSNLLAMDDIETEYDLKQFSQTKNWGYEIEFKPLVNQSEGERKQKLTLHNIYHFPEAASERGPKYGGAWVEVDWNDPGFKKEMIRALTPKIPLNIIEPPKDRLSIAVHWRRGSGKDAITTQNYYPCKLPPEQFYLEQIVRVCKMNPDQPIYLQMFTDDKNPAALEEKIRKAIADAGLNNDIVFGKYEGERIHPVLEDFFSMSKFNCLIRSESAFSLVAEKIGNHRLVISPSRFHTEVDWAQDKGELVIDQITITENGKNMTEEAAIRFPMTRNLKDHSPLKKYLDFHVKNYGMIHKP